MSSLLGILKAFITLDNTGLIKGSRESAFAVEKMSTNIAASLNKTGAAVSGFGKSLTIGLTVPIIAAGAGIVKLASDAEEAGSKFNTVFKDVGKQASSAAKELSKSFGLSSLESKKLLGDTGDLLSGFGFTGEAALDLATQTNKLAVDLASFTNVEGGAERASQALTKALLGERESVKELGIAILEKDVVEKVAELRAKGMTFATDRQAKAQATLMIAMEQSKNAIGDFARTQDSVANRARVLKARVVDLAVGLGTMLLPLANKLIGKLMDMVTTFQNLDPQVKANILVFAGLVAAIGPAVFIIGSLISLGGTLFTVFGALAAIVGFILSPIGLLIVAFIGIGAILMKTGKATEVVGKIWVGLRTTLNLVLGSISVLLRDLTFTIAKFLQGMQSIAEAVGIDLPAGVDNFIGSVESAQSKLDKFADSQFENAAAMSMNWGDAWGTFKTDMTGALEFAEGFATEKVNSLGNILGGITEQLQIGLPGATEEGGQPSTGPGSVQEQEMLDTSATAWQKWMDDQRNFSKVWRDTWSKTAVNVANGFADGFADIIVSGRSFKSVISGLASSVAKDLISQAIKSAIARVAVDETVTAANSAAAAPHPFLIPLFVGIGLAAFAKGIGGTSGASRVGGGGGGGGGGSAGPTVAPQSQALAVTQFVGPEGDNDEAGDGGTDRGATQTIIVEIAGEAIASAVVRETKNGMGDGADTLALAGGNG